MGMYVTPYSDDPATEGDRMSIGLPVNFNLHANSDGSFRLIDAHGFKKFTPLDLYLMGLIPIEEVPPVHMLTNPDFSEPEHVIAQEVKTYTHEEIMNMAGGPRSPAYPDARSDFNIGFIFFSDREFTGAEVAWGSMVAREVTLKESDSINTFYRATNGLATLNARLADWGIPVLSAEPKPEIAAAATPTSEAPTEAPIVSQTSEPASTDTTVPSATQPAGDAVTEPGKPVWNENIPCVSLLGAIPLVLFGTIRKK
jgi:hypothetical protein